MAPYVLSWLIAALAIVFLVTCGWINARTRNGGALTKGWWRRWRAMVAGDIQSLVSPPAGVPTKSSLVVPQPQRAQLANCDTTSAQLMRLQEALGASEKLRTGSQQRTSQPSYLAPSPQSTEATLSDVPEGLEIPRSNNGGQGSNTRRPLNEAAMQCAIAFAWVLTATLLGYGTLVVMGSVPMGLFVVAVILAAGRGLITGVLATGLSLFVITSVFNGQISISMATRSTSALFLAIGIVANILFHRLHVKNAVLSGAKLQLEAVNQQLAQQSAHLAEANSRLAEQKAALFEVHEDLRFLSKQLVNRMQLPLRRISVASDNFVGKNAVRLDPNLSTASGELIKDEIRHMDALVADLAAHV